MIYKTVINLIFKNYFYLFIFVLCNSKLNSSTVLMRCFVPVTATATEDIFRISIGAWLLPGNRESIWPTLGKEGYFFIYYPPLSLLRRWHSDLVGSASADRRGDDEIWDTWLDSKRRHSMANRRRGACKCRVTGSKAER